MINERNDFLDAYCRAPEDCNVDVTAFDRISDPVDRNDSWNVVANNDTGLICGVEGREFVVYGVATGVSFEINADVK